jgi:hypothetical protein
MVVVQREAEVVLWCEGMGCQQSGQQMAQGFVGNMTFDDCVH